MVKLFKLREEAKPFFRKGLHAESKEIDSWGKMGVSITALEEDRMAKVTIGSIVNDEMNIKMISNWDINNGSRFHFTVNIEKSCREFHSLLEKKESQDIIISSLDSAVNDALNKIIEQESIKTK